jgi:ATP-dependent RNA helicase RhlE
MSFTDFALAPDLLRAATGSGYLVATPIQQAVIPAVLAASDVLGIAQTGSGKTAAFVLPLLQLLLQSPPRGDRRVRALVLVPTRELASQVAESVRTLSRFLAAPPKLVALFGGVSINPQMMRLRGGADIVVATPGRLLDLADKNAVALDAVQWLVLDEADRMLDAGFAEELARVLALLPPRRQTLLFSATMPAAVESLAQALLHAPLRVQIADDAHNVPDIVQRCIAVDPARRTQLLRQLIKDHAWKRVLVFVATQHAAETIAAKLYANGV